MNSKLLLISQSGSVDDLYCLIQTDPRVFQKINVSTFVQTPLHEAASYGNINVAMELMSIKPSFSKTLNKDGYSPLHLAVLNDQTELAKELVKFDPSLIRIRGREGMTSLHLVAKKGHADLVTIFLQACPESISESNAKGETIVHISVVNKRFEGLKIIIGWLVKMRKKNAESIEISVINRCDRQGNTALHVAAYENSRTAVEQLLKCLSLNRNIKNKSGKTALDVLRSTGSEESRTTRVTEKLLQNAGAKLASQVNVKEMHVFLGESVSFYEYHTTKLARYRNSMTDGTRNALLVITALIITTTFETGTQPPEEDQSKLGKKIMLKLMTLWLFNTLSFFLAIVLTFLLLPDGRGYTKWYISITLPLICTYSLSLSINYGIYQIFLYAYLIVVFGFFIYLLVTYVRWKRASLNRKESEPKRDLASDWFTSEMV